MKIIIQAKRAEGKTTMAKEIAHHFTKLGFKCSVVDSDFKSNSSYDVEAQKHGLDSLKQNQEEIIVETQQLQRG